MREQPLLPAGQEHRVEFEALGAVQGHDVDHLPGRPLLPLRHQADVIEEGREVLELGERADQLLQVLEPARHRRRTALPPHVDVARFLEHLARDLLVGGVLVRRVAKRASPSPELVQETRQRRPRPGRERVGLDQRLRRAVEREPLRPREAVDFAQRAVAEAAFREVDDTLERQVVVGADQDPEIGHRVADFLPFVEPQAPDHAVGQADGQEALLEGAGLEARADEDGHAVQSLAAALQRLDDLTDRARLLLAVPGLGDADLLAGLAFRPQALAESLGIVGDQPRRGGEDMAGGAVVALQPHHDGAREIPLEAEDVADLGAAPAVDRLVVVADAADVAMLLREQPEPQILGYVGVLVFVHEQVAEARVVFGEDVRVLREDRQVVQEEVAEIGGVRAPQPLLVGGVERRCAAVREVRAVGAGDLIGREPPVLPALDDGGEGAGRPPLLVQIRRLQELPEQAGLVVRVEDREVRREPGERRVAAQHARADRVERAEPEAGGGAPDQRLHPADHLARRLVGEGDRQHRARPGAPGREKMAEPRGEDAGLAGAGAGQHEQRPVERLHGPSLLRIQAGEIGRRGSRRGRRG